MKLCEIKTAYDFMRYCRMPLCFQRNIRDMKVGDTFILGQCKKRICDNREGKYLAEAYIEKERGVYKFYGTWTFITKPSRALIMASGDFKILKGGVVKFDEDTESVKSFALICRYIALMLKCMSHDEVMHYLSAGCSPLFNEAWLDSNLIERRERARLDEGKVHFYNVSYKNNAPTNQMKAIVDVAIALDLLGEDDNEQD